MYKKQQPYTNSPSSRGEAFPPKDYSFPSSPPSATPHHITLLNPKTHCIPFHVIGACLSEFIPQFICIVLVHG